MIMLRAGLGKLGLALEERDMQDNKAWDEPGRLESWELADLRELRDHPDDLIRRKESARPRRGILEFEGIGHGTWDDVGGVEKFLKQERASWDDEREKFEPGPEYERVLAQARLLSIEEQFRLVEELMADVRRYTKKPVIRVESRNSAKDVNFL